MASGHVCVDPMDIQTMCVHKNTDSLNWQCITQWSSTGDYGFSHQFRWQLFWFYFYFYIFLYKIIISDPEMPLFHMGGYCYCVFAYVYICMYAGYAMYCMCLLGFRDSCDGSDVSDRGMLCF